MSDTALKRALKLYPTPFYLFDELRFGADIAHVRNLLPEQAVLCFAMKANPFMVEKASRCTERVEVCSPGELRICQSLGIPDDKLVISGVYKDPVLMHKLVSSRPRIARYTVESPTQFDLLEGLAKDTGNRVPLLLRLTSGNQFGMSEADVKQIVSKCIDNPSVAFYGIQFFSGTQITSQKRLRREIESVDHFIMALERDFDVEVREFEFGPGLPVLYYEDAQNAAEQQDAMATSLRHMLEVMSFQGRIILELGRSISANCGWYATRIVDMKRNETGRYAIVDGGKHQISYYGNAMAMKEPPCQLMPYRGGCPPEDWNVCGSLCTVNDILAKRLQLRGPELGDVLVFERAGAYCMTEGMSLFLSRDLPRVIIRDDNDELSLARDRIETSTLNTPCIYRS